MDQLLDQAQSGRLDDVRPLVRVLPDRTLIVPGVRTKADDMSEPDLIPDFQELQSDPEFQPHLLEDEQERPFLPVYTTPERYEQMPDTASGSDPEDIRMNGMKVVSMGRDLCERDVISGMVINLFHDTELRLNTDEISAIADGTPVPLKDHLRGKEVAEDRITELAPPVDLHIPEVFEEVMSAYVDADPELDGYECVWARNPDVDPRPHLILNLLTGDPDLDHEERAQELHVALSDHVPEPGLIEVTFNRVFEQVLLRG